MARQRPSPLARSRPPSRCSFRAMLVELRTRGDRSIGAHEYIQRAHVPDHQVVLMCPATRLCDIDKRMTLVMWNRNGAKCADECAADIGNILNELRQAANLGAFKHRIVPVVSTMQMRVILSERFFDGRHLGHKRRTGQRPPLDDKTLSLIDQPVFITKDEKHVARQL